MGGAAMLVMFDLDNTLVDRAAAVATWIGEFIADHDLPDETSRWIVELDADGYRTRAVGVRTAWVRRGRPWDDRLAPPHVTIDHLGEVPDLIDA